MSTLGLRIEPTVVRVNDTDSATLQITLDNRRGQSLLRIVLDGHDPDGDIQFTFSPPVIDLGAGRVTAVFLRLYCLRPPPGQELTHHFTVTASDGNVTVDGSGSLVQVSSRAAIELLTVHVNPSVLRLKN